MKNETNRCDGLQLSGPAYFDRLIDDELWTYAPNRNLKEQILNINMEMDYPLSVFIGIRNGSMKSDYSFKLMH